jgi:DNA replication licensing factor MCM5
MFQDDGAIRVIEGPENTGDVQAPDGEFEIEPDTLASKFKKFIREFKYNAPDAGAGHIGTMKYRDQFQQNCVQGYHYLEINLNDLDTPESDGEILAHCLKQRPSTYLPVCERALKELYVELVKKDGDDLPTKAPSIQLMLTYDVDLEGSFGTMKPLKIRQLTADQVEKLVVIQGIVVSAKKSRHKARKVCLRCSNCENYREITVGAGFSAAHIPAACDGNNLRGPMEKCPPNPFVIVDDLCEYVDEQVLKLQELPDHVPVGEMPRHVDLCVSQYLVDRASPGARLTAIGVFCATEHSTGSGMGGGRMNGTDTVKYSYVQVLGAYVSQGSAVEISPEDEEKFNAMARDPQIRDKVYKSIAPAICASDKDVIDEVKKAVACLLFGGSRKLLPDGTRMRGDINVLLLGDPGTAKSQFLKFSEKAAPVAVYTSGKGSSAAGLTAAIVKDKDGFALEGGAMVLADGGIVCIDEFDKMDVKDRVAIHEAMEQQTISIAKAGITTILNSRTSVLAAANPLAGRYDDLKHASEQIDFQASILSRFDAIFIVRDQREESIDKAIAHHVVNLHMNRIN